MCFIACKGVAKGNSCIFARLSRKQYCPYQDKNNQSNIEERYIHARNLKMELRKVKERFLEKVKVESGSGCWIWTACHRKTGYGAFGFMGRTEYAHRASWLLFKGEIPTGFFVCHTCDTRSCVNPDHLFVGSCKDNMQDAARKGRMVIPAASFKSDEKHQVSKLTNEQVRQIRAAPKKAYKGFASAFGVCKETIWNAREGRTFRDI